MREREGRTRERRVRGGRARRARTAWIGGALAALAVAGIGPSTTRAQEPLLQRSDVVYAAVFFGSLALSEPLRGVDRGLGRLADDDQGGADHLFYTVGDRAGDLWTDLAAAALTLGIGELAGSPRVARLGLRSLESLAAVDLLATLFKVGVGRQRPSSTTDPGVFQPIAWSHDFASFPSGHTAHAFALAATAARELGGWTPWLAYPLATGIGLSRVIGGEHWATDVVAGAALGLFTARFTGRLHRRPGGASGHTPGGTRLTALPLPGPRLLLGAEIRAR